MGIITDPIDILNFSSAEKKILEATSKIAISMSQISRTTKIPRSSIPYMLQRLKERGFMKETRNSKRFLWKSDIESPLKTLNETPLSSLTGENDSENIDTGIITYHGTNTLLGILYKMSDLPKNTRVYGFQPDKSIRQAVQKNSMEDLLRLNEGIKKKALIVEGVVHEKSVESMLKELGKESGRKLLDSFIGRLEDYVKVPDDFADVGSEIYIFGGSAYIINWNKETAIGIHDKEMVALLLAMFRCMKDFGQRYSQNDKIKLYSPK